MPMANHETQRFLRGVFANVRDLVLFVVELLQIHVAPAIAHVVHNFIFFNPSVIHSFVLAQFGYIAMNEPIVVRVVEDFWVSYELPGRLEAVTGGKGLIF